MNIKRYIAYFKYVLLHKYYVIKYGLPLKLSFWQLLIHDWSKFIPDEFIPYAQCFYDKHGNKTYNTSQEFTVSWLKHQNRNPHHWQYWIITWDKGNTEYLPMPEKFMREMYIDWCSVGKVLTDNENPKDWYESNKDGIKLHPDSRQFIENLMKDNNS